jgi:carbon monoxide dehydrogenase subunit G
MEMNVERRISASKEKVWEALNDTETLKASIPGCDILDATSNTSFNAHITAKVGPVKAKFKFDVTLTDIDAPNSYTINGQGQGGAAGFANGSAAVSLREDDGETILSYHAKASVGGKLAQLGSRLIDGTAQKMANDFFGTFSQIVSGESAGIKVTSSGVKADKTHVAGELAKGAEVAAKQMPPTQKAGFGVWVWLVGVSVLTILAGVYLT